MIVHSTVVGGREEIGKGDGVGVGEGHMQLEVREVVFSLLYICNT